MTTLSPANIPKNVLVALHILHNANYDGYLVGGCVRDLIVGIDPNDWDITTNAHPNDIIALFEPYEIRVVYENNFGTVALVFEDEPNDSTSRTLEITPYRVDGMYSDSRRPDEVTFSDTIDEDLSRRDFTINALAYDPIKDIVIDNYKGQSDIRDKVIRCVGDSTERFTEDALRMLRAVRFSAQLGFTCTTEVKNAIQMLHMKLQHVSQERIRDEFIKIIMSDNSRSGLELAHELGILPYVSREIMEGIGVDQNKNHTLNVWEHNLGALENAAKQNWPLHIRLAALFHDIGKPRTKRVGKNRFETTFYGHEVVGARMTKKLMERLKFPKKLTELVTKLVRYHMFFSDPDQITLSAVRRMIVNVGRDHIWDLMNVRRADRLGMGRPKAAPYRLRKYEAMIDKALRDPISVGMLKINGDIMLGNMNMKPGRRIGWILHALLEEVLEDPKKNTLEYLKERVITLDTLDDVSLQKMGEDGKEKKEIEEDQELQKIHSKHHVQ